MEPQHPAKTLDNVDLRTARLHKQTGVCLGDVHPFTENIDRDEYPDFAVAEPVDRRLSILHWRAPVKVLGGDARGLTKVGKCSAGVTVVAVGQDFRPGRPSCDHAGERRRNLALSMDRDDHLVVREVPFPDRGLECVLENGLDLIVTKGRGEGEDVSACLAQVVDGREPASLGALVFGVVGFIDDQLGNPNVANKVVDRLES